MTTAATAQLGELANIHDVCDFVIIRQNEAGGDVSHLKLQKLLYYIQAWHLAIFKARMFDGKFQAWVHGPVSRTIYDRFLGQKSLYSNMLSSDVLPGFVEKAFPETFSSHINNVLEVYGKFSGTQLESLTHAEPPWQKARNGIGPNQRCEREIDEAEMASYYSSLIPR